MRTDAVAVVETVSHNFKGSLFAENFSADPELVHGAPWLSLISGKPPGGYVPGVFCIISVPRVGGFAVQILIRTFFQISCLFCHKAPGPFPQVFCAVFFCAVFVFRTFYFIGGVFIRIIFVKHVPVNISGNAGDPCLAGVLPAHAEVRAETFLHPSVVAGGISGDPEIIFFQGRTDHGLIPVHITVDSKTVSGRGDDFFKRFGDFFNAGGSEDSLIFPFQIQKNREPEFTPVQDLDHFFGFPYRFLRSHRVAVPVHSCGDLIPGTSLIIGLKSTVRHITRFCDSQNGETHAVVRDCFPVDFSLPCRNVDAFYFHKTLLFNLPVFGICLFAFQHIPQHFIETGRCKT